MKAKFTSQRDFTPKEHETWREIMAVHAPKRTRQIHPIFMEGLEKLGMSDGGIPDLREVNKKLRALTGWQGAYVEGFEEGTSFYPLLKERIFPIGNFVRDKRDINYTPAPDVVHDFYGHIPFLANADYAKFCQEFGELSCRFIEEPAKFREFERFFWFTMEFSLIETKEGRRIFGAGIVSSVGECEYSLSGKPELRPFDVGEICAQEFRIDEMQKKIFLLANVKQLYDSLPALEKHILNFT